jgi:hypothetical protein
MIYTNLPLKYIFVPIDINNEHFRIASCVFLLGYLIEAKTHYLEIMDNEDTKDGDRIQVAEWAKNLHNFVERFEKEIIIMINNIWGWNTLKNYHKNINLDNCEFDYTDANFENVQLALDNLVEVREYYNLE